VCRASDTALRVAGLLGGLGRLAVDDGQRESVDAAVPAPVVPDAGAHDARQTRTRRGGWKTRA
jgi:hypothetical protein